MIQHSICKLFIEKAIIEKIQKTITFNNQFLTLQISEFANYIKKLNNYLQKIIDITKKSFVRWYVGVSQAPFVIQFLGCC